MTPIHLGSTTVEIHRGYTVTRFADGAEEHALHGEQPGRAETARGLGYPHAEAMNADHDLAHSIVCHVLGMPWSPTLRAVADGKTHPLWQREEAAALAFQAFANAAGVPLIEVARRLSRGA